MSHMKSNLSPRLQESESYVIQIFELKAVHVHVHFQLSNDHETTHLN